jgi:hypothetical protein
MKPNSITIQYKSRTFTLDRVTAEGQYFQIGFEGRNWGIRIYSLPQGDIRVVIEKSIRRGEVSHTQLYWDSLCMSNGCGLIPCKVDDPATGKRIGKRTKWLIVDPIVQLVYDQLKEELDALRPESNR